MNWQIILDNLSLGGFAPAWYKETYPTYGNKNQMGAMTNIDMTNPGFLCQGPGLANLTNGTEAGDTTTLIKGILDVGVTSDTTYAIGGAKLYKISSTAVTDDSDWPHPIDKTSVTDESGEDVAHYKGALYYSYNHSGSAGDIGKYDLSVTFDDDWGSTVPSGAGALTNNPHPIEIGGNDVMYIGNGRYVTSYDGSTFQTQALDLPEGTVITALQWSLDRLWITANRPNLSGSNKNIASIFIWDGTTDSWETEIPLMGTGGASHLKNGTFFQFYQDVSSTGGYKLGYVSGASIVDVANFTGSLPAYYQVTDYKDFIIWVSDGLIYAWGAGDQDLPVRLFQLADAGYSTVGGLACPFGTPLVASYDGTSAYKIAKFSGYDTTSSAKTLLFDVTGAGRVPKVNIVRINFDTLESGARVDWTLKNNQGKTIHSDTISYAKLGAVTSAYYALNGEVTENLRLEFDYSNGSTSVTVKIKNAKIYGTIS